MASHEEREREPISLDLSLKYWLGKKKLFFLGKLSLFIVSRDQRLC